MIFSHEVESNIWKFVKMYPPLTLIALIMTFVVGRALAYDPNEPAADTEDTYANEKGAPVKRQTRPEPANIMTFSNEPGVYLPASGLPGWQQYKHDHGKHRDHAKPGHHHKSHGLPKGYHPGFAG